MELVEYGDAVYTAVVQDQWRRQVRGCCVVVVVVVKFYKASAIWNGEWSDLGPCKRSDLLLTGNK